MERKTSQRVAIENIFQRENRPLGVEEILKEGREIVESLNQATVYRNLKLLVEKGTLKPISHPVLGILYERTGRGHHHHFHCRICDRVFELPGCMLSETSAAPEGFVTEKHEVFLFGICPACGQQQ